MVKAVLAVGGRADVSSSVEINVAAVPPPPSQVPPAFAIPGMMGTAGASSDSATGAPTPKPAEPPPTNCPKCGAPFAITQEDIFITCKYCGNSIILETNEQLRKHRTLENHLFT